jgi:predicted Zn-dependent protease
MEMRLTATVVAIAFAAVTASAQSKKNDPNAIGTRDVGKGVNFYSIEKEIALGKQLAREVERQAKLVDDPLVTEYVNRIGQNLARNSDASFPFTFKVIEDDSVNAFALPGGFVFVNTGLLRVADEEDEFAAAVAHEIAHVAARHMTRRKTQGDIAKLGTIPLSVMLGGWAGFGARQAASAAIPVTFLSFSRADEAEADYLGVQYLWAAGYDPAAAVTILEKLEALHHAQPNALAKLMSTHPMDAERITKTQQEIETILPPRDQYVVQTSDYKAIRQRLLDLEGRKKGAEDPNKPVLKRAPEADGTSSDPEGRPTIRRNGGDE